MIQIEKKILIDTLRAIMPGVDKGATVEGSDTILFSDNKAATYNGSVTVTKAIQMDGYCFAVKAADLYNLVSKIKESAVNLDVDSINNKLKISAGKTKATLTLMDTESISKYLSKIKDGDLKDLPGDFVDALNIVPISNNNNPDLAGVAIIPSGESSIMISTDKLRISTKKLSAKMDDLLVDDAILKQMASIIKPKKYSIVGPWINFVDEAGTRFSAIRKDHTSYPGSKILPALEKFGAMTPILTGKLPKDIAEVVARVNVLSDVAEGKNEHVVQLTFSKDGVNVYAENAGGSAEELVSWDTTLAFPEGLNAEITVASSFITEAVGKSMNFKLIDRGNSNLSFIFEGDGYTCLVASLKKA